MLVFVCHEDIHSVVRYVTAALRVLQNLGLINPEVILISM